MLLPRFVLHRPVAVAEALSLLAAGGEDASCYAGGTELLLAMKHRIVRYAHLVDLKRVPGLADVTVMNGATGLPDRSASGTSPATCRTERQAHSAALVIGALATHRTLERHPLVLRHLPVYAEMTAQIANTRVRAAGTLGGNLCFAEPHADPPALLAALDSRVTVEGAEGSREHGIDEFVLGPFETRRGPGEIVTRITVPLIAGRRVAYLRFGHLERPTIGVAVALTPATDGRTIAAARVRVGSVGGRPSAAPAAERMLSGVGLAAVGALARDAGRCAANEIPVDADLRGSEDYKRHLVAVFVERALRRIAA